VIAWCRAQAKNCIRASRNPNMTIRMLVADDQAVVRAGFRVVLGSAANIEVVGEAADGLAAAQRAATLARRATGAGSASALTR
jgi:hypothetical protein